MLNKVPFQSYSRIIVDGSVVLFAIWTLCCHAVLFAHGNTFHLLILSGSIFILGIGFLIYQVRRGLVACVFDGVIAQDSCEPPVQNDRRDRLAGFIGLVVAMTVLGFVCSKKISDPWLIWGIALGFAIISGAWLLSRPVICNTESLPNKRSLITQEIGLWCLALLGAYITLILRFPNSDDSLYVHIAASAADRPYLEIVAKDTIHNAGFPPMVAYRVHSYELLAGVISLISGIPAIKVIHLGLAGFAGLLTPLAWARLLRLLDPRRWFWMVVVVFCWYLFDGTTPYSPAMHAFARLFQGKAILLTVGIPLIAAYGIRLSLRPSWKRFLMLMAVQIAGIGLSSTGIWICPVVALVSVCVPLRPRLKDLRIVGLGFLSCLYGIGIGLWVHSHMNVAQSPSEALVSSITRTSGVSFKIVTNALSTIFGSGMSHSKPALAWDYLSVIFLSWPLAHTQLARRYIVAFSLIFLIVFANPYLVPFVSKSLTGSATYNRVVFLLPTAFALAVCFTTILYLNSSSLLRNLFLVISAIGLCIFLYKVPRKTILHITDFGRGPVLKVSEESYLSALYLARIMPADSYALVTRDVAMYLPMVQHHPYIIIVKLKWIGRSEKYPRFKLRRLVDGRSKPLSGRHRRWFLKEIDRLKVEGIVSSIKCKKTPGFEETLETAGFRLEKEMYKQQFWRRRINK
jgi:hypothetical protein